MIATGTDLTVQANNIHVAYDDRGTGSVPVIFIHGFPFDKSMWNPQLDVLEKTNRVIAYDIRGFGRTTPGEEKASIILYANDLVEIMDVLEINKAVICGLSMGGYIALNAISRFPERFEKLILCDTQCIADTPEGREKRFKAIAHIESAGLTEYAETFVKNVFAKDSLEAKKDSVDKIRNTILATSPKTVTGTLAALAEREETCFALAEISVPTLIICGKEDIITPPVQAEYLHKNIRNSKLHLIEHAGHMSNLEQADEFNRVVSEFLS